MIILKTENIIEVLNKMIDEKFNINYIELIKQFLSQTEDESAIITATNESMLISYKDAATNNRIENEKHIRLFGLFYKIIFAEMLLLIVTFLVEILV